MKIEFWESEHGTNIEFAPETPQEVAAIYRMVQNSKAEKPKLFMSFGKDEKSSVNASIWIKKLAPGCNKIKYTVSNQ